jgi:hypothetical protein
VARARKKQGANRRSKKPNTVLPDHRRKGRKLVPPLLDLPTPVTELSWHQQMLPDFLWLALMLGFRSDWGAAYSALKVVDRFIPEGPRIADGRLTSFGVVPDDRREAVRRALKHEAPHALPEAFGHALGLFPSCPARWLYDDSPSQSTPDPEIGLSLLRSLVDSHRDKSGVRETRLRMAAISRKVTHRKFSHSGGGVFDLVPKYPTGLTKAEQGQVESAMRAMWLNMLGMEAEKFPEVLAWPRDFWKRSRELTPCKVSVEQEEVEMPKEDEDGPLDPEPLMQLSEMQAMSQAIQSLGDELRDAQLEAVSEPEADEPNAVLLGLASRLYRLLHAFIERPSAWVPATAGLHLRPLVDTRILVGWLITRDEPEIFGAYREHGLGRLKLATEHIKADLGDDLDDEAQQVLDYMDRRVNLERDEWFQTVNLGSFADVSPREMAIEAGLKREYDLSYAPLSSENHGEWPNVRENNTVLCEEILHQGHRVGAFRAPSRTITARPIFYALELAREGICQVFDYYGRDVQALFVSLEKALQDAAYEKGD